MQRPFILRSPHIHLLRLLLAPLDHFQKRDQRLPLIIIQVEGGLIGYPAMDPSSTGVYPQKVAEAECL